MQPLETSVGGAVAATAAQSPATRGPPARKAPPLTTSQPPPQVSGKVSSDPRMHGMRLCVIIVTHRRLL